MLAGANFILWSMTGTELSLKQSLKVPAGESVPWFVVSDLRFCMCNVGPHPGGLVRDPWGCMMQVACSEKDMENSPPRVKSHIIQAMNIHTHIHMGHYTVLICWFTGNVLMHAYRHVVSLEIYCTARSIHTFPQAFLWYGVMGSWCLIPQPIEMILDRSPVHHRVTFG